MNPQTNLAFKLDADTEIEVLDTAELNAVELDALLRLSSTLDMTLDMTIADGEARPRPVRNRRAARVLFRDNHSPAFRPFRVY